VLLEKWPGVGFQETATGYLLVGEDSGGAPNLYGDVQPLDLPNTWLRVEIATTWWVKSKLGANDPRVTFHPDTSNPRPRSPGSQAATLPSRPR
jgi:hypothetical protein